MFCTIITDCFDENAKGRQVSRGSTLFGVTPHLIAATTDIGAAGDLIDIVDATLGAPGVIMVNVAPRGGHTRQWENGTPFGYTWYKETLIVGTVDGFCFSGLKAAGLLTDISVLDTTAAAKAMHQAGFIDDAAAAYLPRTQFRSYEFMPRVAAFLLAGNTLPAELLSAAEIKDLPAAIWCIDNFGNCKTTLTREVLNSSATLSTRFGDLPFYEQLKDLPDGELGIVEGSSGLMNHRFLELNMQRGSAAKRLNVTVGDGIFDESHYGLSAGQL